MEVVILAGGVGTRLSEETVVRPKPMIEIGGRPILWHIMKIYSAYGLNDFVICLGYKGYMIKEYFANYYLHMGDVTIDMGTNEMTVHQSAAEPWRVTLLNTGDDTQTGGRLKRALEYVRGDEFCLTYGDGVADIDVRKLVEFHQLEGKIATVTAVQPPGRFGALELDGSRITGFREKPQGDGGWINGGFFVFSSRVGEYLDDDQTALEREPLRRMSDEGQLAAFQHNSFWHPMDTLRDKNYLEELWASGAAPWNVWKG